MSLRRHPQVRQTHINVPLPVYYNGRTIVYHHHHNHSYAIITVLYNNPYVRESAAISRQLQRSAISIRTLSGNARILGPCSPNRDLLGEFDRDLVQCWKYENSVL
ncbi:hypothetical protein ACOME3_009840 [Neoechinorhynchus agilis]